MLMDSTPQITSVIYSEITRDLIVKYNNGAVEKYVNVPKDIYESIINNGKVLSSYLKESLDTNYKKTMLL